MGEMQNRSLSLSVNSVINADSQDSRIAPGGLVRRHGFNKCSEFLWALLILMRQRISWSPALIAGEFWRYLINIGMRREVLRLLKLRPFAEIIQDNPGLALKYVIPNYLARGFTVTERAFCFLHHYKRMHAVLPEWVLRQILQGDVKFYEISNGGSCFTLTIGLSRPPFDKEGELSLGLQVDGKEIFDLSFSIVPGWVVKSEAGEILLITRLQGAPECRPQLRLLRKRLHEYSPRKLLLAVMQGVADVFGIAEIGAICATRQRCYAKEHIATLKSGYDSFFANVGMVKTAANFYSSPVPIEGKPLASFTGRNRSRARKRRALRQQVKLACGAFLLGTDDRVVHSASRTVNSPHVPSAG